MWKLKAFFFSFVFRDKSKFLTYLGDVKIFWKLFCKEKRQEKHCHEAKERKIKYAKNSKSVFGAKAERMHKSYSALSTGSSIMVFLVFFLFVFFVFLSYFRMRRNSLKCRKNIRFFVFFGATNANFMEKFSVTPSW